MMAPLWGDIGDDVASAKRHRTMGEAAGYLTAMAFQHAMQAGYTSFETAMRRLLHGLEETLPEGPAWHATLVRRLGRDMPGARPAVFEAGLLASIEELHRFRHVAMHSYDDVSPRKAVIPVEAATVFVASIDTALAGFQAAIDPPP